MKQVGPDPEILLGLVYKLRYKAGWEFDLEEMDRGQGSEGLTLIISVTGVDSYHPENGPHYTVLHYMIVPAAAYDERSWCRWLLDQIVLVEQHEACEFFKLGEHRPYAPHHAPGRNPYSIIELGTDEEVHTTYRGEKFK